MTTSLPKSLLSPAAASSSAISAIPIADADGIRWPEGYSPGSAQVFVSNQIVVPATADAVWAALVRAQDWPRWYANASEIHFLSHTGPDLRDRSRFRWRTFGADVTSKVLEFEPGRRLAWDVHAIG